MILITIWILNLQYLNSIVSFADDKRLYHGIFNVDDCTILQNDLNSVYDWASCNNTPSNAQKFQYICFSPHSSLSLNMIYTSPRFHIIKYFRNNLDLGILWLLWVVWLHLVPSQAITGCPPSQTISMIQAVIESWQTRRIRHCR